MSVALDSSGWGVQQLAGLLAGISAHPDVGTMVTAAAHRIAEAVDADVSAVVTVPCRIAAAVGFPAGDVPVDDLLALTSEEGGPVAVAGLGRLDVAAVSVAGDAVGSVLVGRADEPLDREELHVVRTMGQVLDMAMQLRATADRERELREQSEQQAATLRTTNEALRAASRTKDQVIAVTSHELRTPLTSILGFTETLRQHGDDLTDAQRSAYLEVVERQGTRLLRLIDDLLTASSLDAGRTVARPERVPVLAAVRRLVATHDLLVDVTGTTDAVARVDPLHLDQMVLNLLTNAVKYGEDPFWVEVHRDEEEVQVVVVDAGDGIPASFEHELFDRFTQASSGLRRESTGTGLGLSIVQGLAASNDGAVTYRRSGDRTHFVVHLPRWDDADTA